MRLLETQSDSRMMLASHLRRAWPAGNAGQRLLAGAADTPAERPGATQTHRVPARPDSLLPGEDCAPATLTCRAHAVVLCGITAVIQSASMVLTMCRLQLWTTCTRPWHSSGWTTTTCSLSLAPAAPHRHRRHPRARVSCLWLSEIDTQRSIGGFIRMCPAVQLQVCQLCPVY